jgi:hypothetical protein
MSGGEGMSEILVLIGQFGVIPLLLLFLHKMYIRVKELQIEIKKNNEELIKAEKDKSDEIREIEKQNVGLLMKAIAAINKITEKRNEE